MSQLSNLYLFFYNSLQAFGWAISLIRILSNCFATISVNGAYASTGELICLLQTLAFLEVVHGAIGIVPNGVLLPLMQWGGRIHVLIAIARGIDEVKVFSSIFVTFVAWCSIEVGALSVPLTFSLKFGFGSPHYTFPPIPSNTPIISS